MIIKYSRLYLAAGATKEQIAAVAKKLGVDPKELLSLVQETDISGKRVYEVWLLKQVGLKNIILPEDKERVQKVLKDFEILNNRNQLQFKNIQQYLKIHTLEDEIREVKGEALGESFSFDVQKYLKLPGVELYGQNSEWLILEVSDPESLSQIADSTNWCTINPTTAKYYLSFGNQYVIFKKEGDKLVKYAQAEKNFSQFKNVKDDEILIISDSLYELLTTKLPATDALRKRNKKEIIKVLPTLQEWTGDLDLSGTDIEELPENFKVSGNLNLSNCLRFRKIPKGLRVLQGDLILSNTAIRIIPEKLQVREGSVDLSNCKNLEKISEGLIVGKRLILNDCVNLTQLPSSMIVTTGGLFRNCKKLKSLPSGEDFALGWNSFFDFTGCTELEFLPEDFNPRKSSFYFIDCVKLQALPKKGGQYGELCIQNCGSLKELPQMLECSSFIMTDCNGLNGDVLKDSVIIADRKLHIKNCNNITSTTVLRNSDEGLVIENCQNLKEIPKIYVGESFYSSNYFKIKNCPQIEKIPEEYYSSSISLIIENCPNLKALPQHLEIYNLSIIGCPQIIKLPENTFVKQREKITGVNESTGQTWKEEYQVLLQKRLQKRYSPHWGNLKKLKVK